MELLLLRHADAETQAASDDERVLSVKGEAQAKKVARFIEAHELAPGLILTSPVRRAFQTATIVASHVRAELITVRWAACGMHPESATAELRAYANFDRLILVGHEPDFSTLTAHLLGMRDGAHVVVRKASLTLLELGALAPAGARLHWSLPSRFM
ncbi:MAG: phosphohistidine phosphatase SixA [Chthoniobacteraceae bacterium]